MKDETQKKNQVPQVILGVMRRWWTVCSPIGIVLASIAAAIVYYTFVPVYRSDSWIRILENSPYIAFKETVGKSRFVETQLQLIESPMVLDRTIRNPSVRRLPAITRQDDPANWVNKHLKVTRMGRSELYKVGFQHEDPKTAQVIADALSRAYLAEYENTGEKESERLIGLLDKLKKEREERVKAQQEKLKTLTDDFNGTAIEQAEDKIKLVEPLQALQQHLVNASVRAELLRIERESAKAQAQVQEKVEITEDAVMLELQQEPIYTDLQRLKVQREGLLSAGSEDAPYIRKRLSELEKELKRVEADFEQARTEKRESMQKEAESARTNILAQMDKEIETQNLTIQMLEREYKDKLKQIHKGNKKAWELQFQKDELDREKKVFDLIGERAFVLRTELSAPGQVKLLREADLPLTPVEKIPVTKMALFGSAAFLFPFMLAFLWDMICRRLTTAEDIRQLQVPLLGEIAVLPKVQQRSIGSRQTATNLSLFRESIDSLRTGLVLSKDLTDLQVLSVTSATKSEGKTSVASQLAISIARASQERTLLIDGDIRRPDLHEIFSVPASPGLAEVLEGETVEMPIHAWSEYLDVMPSGTLKRNPHQLVAQLPVEEMIKELRKVYRYIVIDTPPVLSASESLVYSRNSDATVVATMRDVSRADQVRACYDRLLSAGANPIGAVLNAVPTSRYSYYYGHYDSRNKSKRAD